MEQAELLTLIEACRAGDRSAQEKLVMETQNRVYYHCKKFLKNEEDALDATQDVLIAMITGLDKLREPAAFWGWLNGITANRCKHLLTQGTKEWQIPEDEEGNSMLDSVETLDDQTVPDKVIDNAETQRLVMDIIDALPAEQRMTVTFFYYDEMSVKEIARAMDVSEGTVKSRLNYARKAIKAEVEKLEKKDGTKLYSVSILPFLAYFLRRGAQSQTLSPAAASALTQGALAATAPAGVASAAGAGASTTAATATAVGTKTAGAAATTVGAKAATGVGIKLIAGVLAGTLALGGIGGGVYLATHREPERTHRSVTAEDTEDTPTPEPAQAPPLYAATYAAKVLELVDATVPEQKTSGGDSYADDWQQAVDARRRAAELAREGKRYGQYRFALAYIDEDDVPELLAVFNGYQMSIYTYADGQLYTVKDDLTASRLGFPGYYPHKNVMEETYVDATLSSKQCYRINESHQLEGFFLEAGAGWDPTRSDGAASTQGEDPNWDDLGSVVSLDASLTAEEVLTELG